MSTSERSEIAKRACRENYNVVRNHDHAIYERVCAFASTVGRMGSTEDLGATVEKFCMSMLARIITEART